MICYKYLGEMFQNNKQVKVSCVFKNDVQDFFDHYDTLVSVLWKCLLMSKIDELGGLGCSI